MSVGMSVIVMFPSLAVTGNRYTCRRFGLHVSLEPQYSLGRLRTREIAAVIDRRRSYRGICRSSNGTNEPEVNGGHNAHNSSTVKGLSYLQTFLDFATANFLPIALISGVALGMINPTPGFLAHKYALSKFSTFGIFLISGLVLRDTELTAAKKAWPAGLFGLVSILLFTPLASHLILKLQLTPQEFVTGLAIFCCMPTTLSSGVALTQLVRGNSALALAMTVLSNLIGILIVPFTLSKFLAAGVGASVPSGQLFISLTTSLLVPLILGKGIRNSFGSLAKYVDQNRVLFSMTSAVLLSLVPWVQVSKSRSLLLMVKPRIFFIAVVMATVLHLGFLLWNMITVHSLKIAFGNNESAFTSKENVRAVILVASQKTLPVMVAVVDQLGGAFGEAGLLVLPCVVAHLNQIIIDSFLVNYWLHSDKTSKQQ